MYPRVTEILREVGLIEPMGPWVTPWHMERGTVIHQATVLDDEGDLDDDSLDEEVLRRVNLYRSWKADHAVKIIDREQTKVQKVYGYTGTYDILATVDGERTVVDIKQWPAKWHAIQLAAYESLCGMPAKRVALYLGGKKYRHVEHDDAQDWQVFKAALELYRWKMRNNSITEPAEVEV